MHDFVDSAPVGKVQSGMGMTTLPVLSLVSP